MLLSNETDVLMCFFVCGAAVPSFTVAGHFFVFASPSLALRPLNTRRNGIPTIFVHLLCVRFTFSTVLIRWHSGSLSLFSSSYPPFRPPPVYLYFFHILMQCVHIFVSASIALCAVSIIVLRLGTVYMWPQSAILGFKSIADIYLIQFWSGICFSSAE